MKKEYTIQIGEVFTEQKAQELKEYLEAKDKEFSDLFECWCKHPSLNVVHRKDKVCYVPNEEIAPNPATIY